MCDGDHAEESHYNALNYYFSALDDQFIYIVDYWNKEGIRKGTLDSIEKNNITIKYKKEIFTEAKKAEEVVLIGGTEFVYLFYQNNT